MNVKVLVNFYLKMLTFCSIIFTPETCQDIKRHADETQLCSSHDLSSSFSNGEEDQPSPKKFKPDFKMSTAVSYICQLAPLPGKFFPSKAIKLGVPKGPLFGELQSGKTVTLQDGRQVGIQSTLS